MFSFKNILMFVAFVVSVILFFPEVIKSQAGKELAKAELIHKVDVDVNKPTKVGETSKVSVKSVAVLEAKPAPLVKNVSISCNYSQQLKIFEAPADKITINSTALKAFSIEDNKWLIFINTPCLVESNDDV